MNKLTTEAAKTEAAAVAESKLTIEVYMDDGRVFEYDVDSQDRAREHCAAIAQTGYRHNDGKVFEHYPAHRVSKIKVSKTIPTKYPDRVRGT